jgi:hypothetical protein
MQLTNNTLRIIGLIIMFACSLISIFGAYWYTEFAISPEDSGLRLLSGLIFGLPLVIITLITIWRPKTGSLIAIAISIFAIYIEVVCLIGGDSEPRLIWSLLVLTAVYLIGIILVKREADKKQIA